MMKILIALLLLTAPAFAFDTIGFKAYSTATTVGTTCSVIGGHAGGVRTVTNAFSPIPSSARTYDLGTKGFRLYSTTALPGTQVLVNCYTTASTASTAATSTPAYVKIFFDGDQSFLFPVTNQLFYVK